MLNYMVADRANLMYIFSKLCPSYESKFREIQPSCNAYMHKQKSEMRGDETVSSGKGAIIEALPVNLPLPDVSLNETAIVAPENKAIVHELADCDSDLADHIYYVTDVHLEHQLQIDGKPLNVVRELIADKMRELVTDEMLDDQRRRIKTSHNDLLLVGGDIAHSVELEKLFYEELGKRWYGVIVAVLGNHELWDGDSSGNKVSREVTEIFDDYRRALSMCRIRLLENALLIKYKGREWRSVSEEHLLESDADDLSKLCRESTCIVLGGLGFTGRNPKYNAAMGLYRNTISTEDDRRCSQRFRSVYEKVKSCASNRQVIVLTHTQMADWSSETYNPNWIYVNGHTHQNVIIRRRDGTTVLSDNQIGYEPKEWCLHGFTRRGVYDPFETWIDGIYKISREQYVDFNRGHGIAMFDFRFPGDLYALKRNGVYMFFLKSSKSLCMLEGGRRHKVEYAIEYYYENMGEYVRRVEASFRPYRLALNEIAKEVRAFGGQGTVHGCIVDIDFLNHIYLNPFDGTLTPYFAWSMNGWEVYPSVPALLNAGKENGFLPDRVKMSTRYQKALETGEVPTLARHTTSKDMSLATIPKIFIETTMAYAPSNAMRKVQYALDQGLIRVWNDAVLGEDRRAMPALEQEPKRRRGRPSKLDGSGQPKPGRIKMTPDERRRNRAEEYVTKVSMKSDGKLKIEPDDYTGSRDKVKVRCLKCGHKWTRRADHLLERCICPRCK